MSRPGTGSRSRSTTSGCRRRGQLPHRRRRGHRPRTRRADERQHDRRSGVIITPLLALLQAAQTAAVPLEGGARNPAFSHDGRIAIEARGDLWIADSLTGSVHWKRVTSGVAWDRAPAWTTDGTAIVFSSDRSGNFDLWRVDVPRSGAPSEPRRITTSPDPDGEPTIAPDGSIVFVRGRAQGADLWVRTAAGEERRLTREPGAERAPAISPDGRRVAYAALRAGGSRIRVVG